MASIALHAPAVVCSQTKEFTGLETKIFSPISGCQRRKSLGRLHDKCLPWLSNTSSTKAKQGSWVAMSVSKEATTETLGGVKDVENEASLEQYFREAGDKLVVLDISTKTCGPCRIIYPKLVKMSKEYPDAVFLKIMGDLNKDTRALMRKWGVRSVPNFRFFRNGELIHSHTGANEDELRSNFVAHYEKVSQQ